MTEQVLKGGPGARRVNKDAQAAGRTERPGREGSGTCDLNPDTTAVGLKELCLYILGEAEGNPKDTRLDGKTQCSTWEKRQLSGVIFFFRKISLEDLEHRKGFRESCPVTRATTQG